MTRLAISLMAAGIILACFSALAMAQPTDAAPAALDVTIAPTTAKPGDKPDKPTEATKALTPAEAAEEDPVGTAAEVVNDIRAGNWREAVVGLLALLMFGLVRVRDKIKIFKGDRGGAALVMVLAVVGSLTVALATEAPLDWRLFLGAATAAWTAAGAVGWFKRIIWPKE